MKKKLIVTAAATAALLAFGSVTVFAAEGYSYLNGQERSSARIDAYAEAETIESEEERQAFLNERGIADTEWSEEAAASFSYVGGRQRGASYRSDDTDDGEEIDNSSYSFAAGRQRGSSYRK